MSVERLIPLVANLMLKEELTVDQAHASVYAYLDQYRALCQRWFSEMWRILEGHGATPQMSLAIMTQMIHDLYGGDLRDAQHRSPQRLYRSTPPTSFIERLAQEEPS